MTRSDEPRSNLSVGMDWASRIMTVGFAFALPPLLGAWVDRRFGSGPAALLAGALLGFGLGMMYVLKIAREGTGGPPPRRG